MSSKVKYFIPNAVTMVRIIAAIVMIFLPFPSVQFFVVYGVCGLSDALDGFLARKLNASSKFGSLLDSISDLVFYGIMGVKIFPTMLKLFNWSHWIFFIAPLAIHIIAYIVCAIRYKKFSAIHTYANKALGLLVFLFPFTLIGEVYLLYTLYIYIGGCVAIYASTETLLIHIISKRYDDRNKSIFLLKRNEKRDEEEMVEPTENNEGIA